jgi:hypothetical protein
VKDTQRAALPHLRSLGVERREDSVLIDAATRRNLELEHSLSGQHEHTLWGSWTAASPPWADGCCDAGCTARCVTPACYIAAPVHGRAAENRVSRTCARCCAAVPTWSASSPAWRSARHGHAT